MDVKLVLFKQNGQRKDIPVPPTGAVLGRAEDCDLRIPLAKVSRRHCEVLVNKQSVTVKDLGSSNGTLVNQQKVEQAELKPGDSLTVGVVTFIIQIGGQPADIQPPPEPSVHEAEPAAPAVSGKGEEVVDLEAAEEDDVLAALQSGLEAEDDPIAALEALAEEGDKKDKNKGQ